VVDNNRKEVLFVIEGSKDALAAAELAFRSGMLAEVGILRALGSGYRPIASEIEQLSSRRVELIGDRDAAGVGTTSIVSRALHHAVVEHRIWDWSNWANQDDKDLFNVLITIDSNPSTHFFFPFFSSFSQFNGSTVQQFNSRERNRRNNWNNSAAICCARCGQRKRHGQSEIIRFGALDQNRQCEHGYKRDQQDFRRMVR